MVRTQIQLTREQHRQLKRWARERGISLAEAVRRCVAERLASEQTSPTYEMLVREALRVVGAYHDPEGVTDVGKEHDRYLAEAYRK